MNEIKDAARYVVFSDSKSDRYGMGRVAFEPEMSEVSVRVRHMVQFARARLEFRSVLYLICCAMPYGLDQVTRCFSKAVSKGV